MRRVCLITGSRADESPLLTVISEISRYPEISFSHIRTEGLYGHEAHLKSEIESLQPDIIVLLGDRYETLVAASIAALLCVPIAHIHGGEETEGAVDNGFRHAITKLSYWHFASHKVHAIRILQMGESPDRVFNVGAPGIDSLLLPRMDRKKIESELGIKLIPPIVLVTYHPETLSSKSINEQILSLWVTIHAWEHGTIIISGANSDIGGEDINKSAQLWDNGSNIIFRMNYDRRLYISLMHECDVMIGNSSGAIIEGGTLGKKIITIGDRQKGRETIGYGIPGMVSKRIVELLSTLKIPERPIKRFYDIAH